MELQVFLAGKDVFALLLLGFGKSLEKHIVALPPLMMSPATIGDPWAIATWFNWQQEIRWVQFELDRRRVHPIALSSFWSPFQIFSINSFPEVHVN